MLKYTKLCKTAFFLEDLEKTLFFCFLIISCWPIVLRLHREVCFLFIFSILFLHFVQKSNNCSYMFTYWSALRGTFLKPPSFSLASKSFPNHFHPSGALERRGGGWSFIMSHSQFQPNPFFPPLFSRGENKTLVSLLFLYFAVAKVLFLKLLLLLLKKLERMKYWLIFL